MRKPRLISLIFCFSVLLPAAVSDAAKPEIQKMLDKGNYEAAYQELLGELDKNPADENTLFLLGMAAPSGNRTSLFLKEYLQKFPKGKHADKVRRYLMDYYEAAGLHITAGRLYPDNPSRVSTDPQDLYRIALIKQQLGLYDEAIGYFRDAITSGNNEVSAWSRLGLADCAYLKKDYRSAEKQYQDLLDKYPDSRAFPFFLIGLSETYRKEGDLDKASSYYQLYRERYELSPGIQEIETAILDKRSETDTGDLPSILDVDYFIQVGVFAKKSNAKKCVRRFRNLGYRSKMDEFSQNGKTFYKALLGPYSDEKTARNEKAKLEKTQGEEYTIILQ